MFKSVMKLEYIPEMRHQHTGIRKFFFAQLLY